MTDQELVEKAFAMLERSYSPYSHFPVGAALEGGDGTVYTGYFRNGKKTASG